MLSASVSVTPIGVGEVPSAIEADMHVVYVRVLFHFMRDGRHGLGASCISALSVRAVSADAGGDDAGGDELARENLAVTRREARPVRRLPDVEPYDDFRPSRWCHGGILQSSGRSEALPATPTLPGRGARARQFPISRSERRAPPVATPPGPSSGQGQTAIRRRPIGGPSGLARIVGNAPNARHRSSSVAYLRP